MRRRRTAPDCTIASNVSHFFRLSGKRWEFAAGREVRHYFEDQHSGAKVMQVHVEQLSFSFGCMQGLRHFACGGGGGGVRLKPGLFGS